MSKPSVSAIKIIKISDGSNESSSDLLAAEEPLEIRIGYGAKENRSQKSIAVTMRTPGHDFELAVGFLLTEGIINTTAAILSVKYCTELNTIENKENIVRVELKEDIEIDTSTLQRNFYATSSCGVCGKASIESIQTICEVIPDTLPFCINKEIILSLPEKLRERQNVFEYTGGLHACALFDQKGNLVLAREDIGRHNALDKLIAAGIVKEENKKLNKYILLLSGRASFELIQKSAMAGIKIVCAIGAPSSLAVEMAKTFGITLIGFLRDQRFNIYSNEQRIKFEISLANK